MSCMWAVFVYPPYQKPKTPDEDVRTGNISWQMCRLTVALWPFEPWPHPIPNLILLGLVALTPFWETNRYFCVGCMKCVLNHHLSSSYLSSSAAGCNFSCFWGLNDRHVFHILIFKQLSYSYCERCRCDMLSFFHILAWCLTDVRAWQRKSVGEWWW